VRNDMRKLRFRLVLYSGLAGWYFFSFQDNWKIVGSPIYRVNSAKILARFCNLENFLG